MQRLKLFQEKKTMSQTPEPVKPDRGSPPGIPRWVKVSVIIAAIIVVLLWVTMNLIIPIIGGPMGH